MRRKQQPENETYEWSAAATILPGKGNSGRKGKSAGRQPEAPQFFAPPEAALTPAQFAPPTTAAAPAPAGPPAAAPLPALQPAMATAAAAGYPAPYPAAPGFPPQPLYADAPSQPGYGQPGVPPAGYTPINFLDEPTEATGHKGEHKARRSLRLRRRTN